MRQANYPMSIEETAKVFVKSGMFPDLKSEDQASALLIIGRGYNLSDYDSTTGIYMRQGKLNMHANVMASAIKASGKYDYEVIDGTDKRCEIQFYRIEPGIREPHGKHAYTIEQAARANLTKNFTWKQYPEAMLFARCISAGYRAHCPDALGASPVYVEQHGEMEVGGAEDDASPPAQRAVPQRKEESEPNPKDKDQEPSTMVDESPVEIPIRVALLNEITEWAGVPKEEGIQMILSILDNLNLSTDGSADEYDLGMIFAWCKELRAKDIDYEQAIVNYFSGLEASLQCAMGHEEEGKEDQIDF
jgi:hypothetical protein